VIPSNAAKNPHDSLGELKPPLCGAEKRAGKSVNLYVGVFKSKTAVSTFNSRVTINGFQSPASED